MTNLCFIWSAGNTKWNESDWTWEECKLIKDLCKWGENNNIWQNANWKWSTCPGEPPIPPIPPTGSIFVPVYGVDATTLIPPWVEEPWNPYRQREKKKKLIKLICKVKGVKFEEEKEVEDLNISIDDIKMVINRGSKIDLSLKLEE